ncbi:MAG: hypothetical protein ACKVN9_06420 [Methylophilaceae bacterium]
MKFTIKDFRKLQIPLITLLAALVIAWLMINMASAREVRASEALQTQQAALSKAKQLVLSSGSEKDNINKYLPLYDSLIKRGFVGEEQRVDWISDLRHVSQQNKLFGVSYDIDAQEDYKPAFPLNIGSFKLHRSVMKLTFALLHENDMFTLLNALPGEVNPPFMVRDCTVTRTNSTQLSKFVPNLNAACDIDWLTLAEPKVTP